MNESFYVIIKGKKIQYPIERRIILMLACLKKAEFHTNRIGKDFVYGDIVRARNLEQPKVEEFFMRFGKLLPELVELKAITKNRSRSFVETIFQTLTKTRQSVVRLSRMAELKNPLVGVIMNRVRNITKVELENINSEINAAINAIVQLETGDQMIRKERITNELQKLLEETEKTEINTLKRVNEIISLVEEEKIRNQHLEDIVKTAYVSMDEQFFVLKDSLEVQEFVSSPELQSFPNEVISFIASKFCTTRGVTIFENGIGEGQNLMHFKTEMKSKEEVFTYGTDENVELCRIAKQNGVDFVAKKGIHTITHNTFDITLNFMNHMNFYHDEEIKHLLPESIKYNYIFTRQIPKIDGYIVFNIPYFKIDEYANRIGRDVTIEGMYRVDDVMSNVLFICRYRRDKRFNEAILRKAILNYDKLPHYTEMQEIFINKGELLHPKAFRPYFVDNEDIEQAFIGGVDTLDLVEEYYTPMDKIIELNAPLQEYREGHLPAVATIEIINGLYDTKQIGDMIIPGIDFPNIYSTKIVQQDVTEEIEEMHKGEMVRIISQKKKNIIVANALLPNGEIVELLKTN